MFRNIPIEISNLQFEEDDINILIGENGSGKSTLLNDILIHYSLADKNTIAIANTIHDKFNFKGLNVNTLKSNKGRSIVRNVFFSSLLNYSNRETGHYRNIANILKYVSYAPKIGFKINFVLKNLRNTDILELLTPEEEEVFNFTINRYIKSKQYDDIVWIDFSQKNFFDIVDSYFLQIFKHYKKFKKIKLIREINLFMDKDSNRIPLYGASSGELTVISSLIYISSCIQENTVILVDEPENSLHPKWQTEYTKKIIELFYMYTPKIIIATHSPIIVSSSESNFPKTKIFKSENNSFTLQKKEPLNVEEILFRYFDLNTPENRFLSDRIVRYLNLLSNNKINLESFHDVIDDIINNSYDKKQISVLEDIKNMGREITNNMN